VKTASAPASSASSASSSSSESRKKIIRYATLKKDTKAPPGLSRQIYRAAFQSKLDVLRPILEEWSGNEAIYNFRDGESNWNALIWASIDGNEEMVTMLIAAGFGAELEVETSDNGATALGHAAARGHAAVCRILIDEGARVTSSSSSSSPVALAREHGHAAIASMLEGIELAEAAAAEAAKAFVAHIKAQGKGFRLPSTTRDAPVPAGVEKQIADAATSSRLDVLLSLCKEYAGYSPLFESGLVGAATFRNEDAVRILVAAGASVNSKNALSISQNKPAICRILVEEGADVNAKILDGKTLLDYLRELQRGFNYTFNASPQMKANHNEIIALLLQHGASGDLGPVAPSGVMGPVPTSNGCGDCVIV